MSSKPEESNPLSDSEIQEMLSVISKDIRKVPPLPRKPVTGKCWVPIERIKDGRVNNEYSEVRYRNTVFGRHLIAATIREGASREDHIALHECDRKPCCNPDHVTFGTYSRNTKDAIARGLLVTSPPKKQVKRLVKYSEANAAHIKYLFNERDWYVAPIAERFTKRQAIATYLQIPVATVNGIIRLESWRDVRPERPLDYPTMAHFPWGSRPPTPQKTGILGSVNVELLLEELQGVSEMPEFIARWALRLGVNPQTIRNVISGRSWAEIRDDLQRKRALGNGNIVLSPRSIQQIRATHDAHPNTKGLRAALARKFNVGNSHIGIVVERISRREVIDDPTAVIPLSDLHFKELTPRGERHRLHKLTDEQVFELLTLLAAHTPVMALAKKYGVSQNLIYSIKSGKTRRTVFDKFWKQQSGD